MSEWQPCPWPAAALLPHRPPMLLVDEVLGHAPDRVLAALTVRADNPFLLPEGLPGHVAIEVMAQACGCWAGIQARLADQPPRLGFLLGTRAMKLHRAWFQPGERLLVTAALSFRDGPLGSFAARLDAAGEVAAEGDLTVYEPPKDGTLPS